MPDTVQTSGESLPAGRPEGGAAPQASFGAQTSACLSKHGGQVGPTARARHRTWLGSESVTSKSHHGVSSHLEYNPAPSCNVPVTWLASLVLTLCFCHMDPSPLGTFAGCALYLELSSHSPPGQFPRNCLWTLASMPCPWGTPLSPSPGPHIAQVQQLPIRPP